MTELVPLGVQSMAALMRLAFEGVAGEGDSSDVSDTIGGLRGLNDGTKAGIVAGWSGGSASGADSDVYATMAAIKDAAANGYTVVTVSSTGTRSVPENVTEVYAVLVGGGKTGQNGQRDESSAGGDGGGYICELLDPQQVAGETLTVNIAPVGGSTTVYMGATKLAECGSGTTGGIAAGPMGYASTTSVPGRGGNGGTGRVYNGASSTAGQRGTSSAKATGGNGGASSSGGAGGDGSAGGNADPAASVKSAGGGGGGGGGGGMPGGTFGAGGGAGGPGGYPGGGGGGGGGAGGGTVGGWGTNGAGGIGAVGIVWLMYK